MNCAVDDADKGSCGDSGMHDNVSWWNLSGQDSAAVEGSENRVEYNH